MTLKQFFKILKEDEGIWGIFIYSNWEYLRKSQKLNLVDNETNPSLLSCPLTASFNKPSISWGNCARDLGLPDYIAQYIVSVADHIKSNVYEDSPFVDFEEFSHPDNLNELKKRLLKVLKPIGEVYWSLTWK